MNERNPLSGRKFVLSGDVADAIERLVEHSGMNLPLPLDKETVIDELIQITHLQEDGSIAPITKIVEWSLRQSIRDQLTDSSLFSAGYQHYERRSRLPLVPVTDFFFKVVWSNGNDPTVATCFDAMSDYEVRQSLPKRRSAMRLVDEDGEFVRDDDTGDVLHSGAIAGVIVFPANHRTNLLRYWLERRSNVAQGQMAAVVQTLGHARPDSVAVDQLREHVNTVGPSMRKALPPAKVKRPPPSA